MSSKKKFLTAEWRKLIMANYAVNPAILKTWLPAKTELDTWNDKYYVSLVGFMFMNTRIFGLRVPFHSNFPEVNLRFYVRYKEKEEWKRGVVFIREIVPRPALSYIANKLFNERYLTMPMKNDWKIDTKEISIRYEWKSEKWNSLAVKANPQPESIAEGSKTEFITEHYWGYSSVSKEKTGEYHVQHPKWKIYHVNSYNIDCDFKSLYGNEFAILQDQQPESVFLAEGSAVSVYTKRIV